MRLDEITPVILTLDEEPNIGRVLEQLAWAKDIVVVDSFSTDRTAAIVRGFANARLFERAFDSHERQWTYAVRETRILSEWVLTLDADYIVPGEFAREAAALEPPREVAGYEARFRYCIHGRPLKRSIYPARIVLLRAARAAFYQDGHTQRVAVEGEVRPLATRLDHDDRKPTRHWLLSQDRYARLEREKLRLADPRRLGFADRIRRRGFLSPVLVLFYCLFAKGMIFEGLPGWYYTYQRVAFEILLSLYVTETRLERETREGG